MYYTKIKTIAYMTITNFTLITKVNTATSLLLRDENKALKKVYVAF